MKQKVSWRSRLLVFMLAFAVMFTFSANMNQAYAAAKTPGRVTVSKLTAVSSSSIKVTWKKASNAKKYQIYASTSKNKNFKRVATVSSSKRSYTVTKLSKKALKANKKYYFKVRAVNGKKKGKWSATYKGKLAKRTTLAGFLNSNSRYRQELAQIGREVSGNGIKVNVSAAGNVMVMRMTMTDVSVPAVSVSLPLSPVPDALESTMGCSTSV